jgi:hypothetical protein
MMTATAASTRARGLRSCAACVHFRNDAAALEAAFPGLNSLSSALGSVRGDDGLCRRHDGYLSARGWCDEFEAADGG